MDFCRRADGVHRSGSYLASAADSARRGIRTPDRLIKRLELHQLRQTDTSSILNSRVVVGKSASALRTAG